MSEIQDLDFSRIIKRLELIKSLLLMEEEDEISMHLEKLRGFPLGVQKELANKIFSQLNEAYKHNNLEKEIF